MDAVYDEGFNWGLAAIHGLHAHSHFVASVEGYGMGYLYLAEYTLFRDYCLENYDTDGYRIALDECIRALHDESRDAGHTHATDYWDWQDPTRGPRLERLEFGLKALSLGAGAIMDLAGIKLRRSVVLTTLAVVGFIGALPQVFRLLPDFNAPYGVDYAAYLQQSHAVYMGERDYAMLSSSQGACYYPAGHIWQYFPVVWLHKLEFLRPGDAIRIMIVVHLVIQQVVLVVAAKIAYLYFAEPDDSLPGGYDYHRSARGQLIALGYLANVGAWGDSYAASLMFNDQFMALYLVIAVYCFATNRVYTGAALIAVAYSIKAGALLVLPGVLGTI